MTFAEFERAAPDSLGEPLEALWWAGHGDWHKAHAIAQDIESADGSWIHAYLHRAEGDAFNAAYWYRRAGKPVASCHLRHEWESLVAAMLPE